MHAHLECSLGTEWAGDCKMDEAYEFLATHGDDSVLLLKEEISQALTAGEEARALCLDELLQAVETLSGGAKKPMTPETKPRHNRAAY